MRGSNYLNSDYERPKSKLKKVKRSKKLFSIFSVFAIFFSILGIQPLVTSAIESSVISSSDNSSTFVSADAFPICANPANGQLGVHMNGKQQWHTSFVAYPGMDLGNRYLTLNEAAGRGVLIPSFEGAGKKEDLDADGLPDTIFVSTDGLTEDQVKTAAGVSSLQANTFEKFKQARSISGCFWTPVGKFVSNLSFGVIGTFTSLASGVSNVAFNPKFICDDPNSNGGCINLLSVIGGDDSGNEGVIGNLTNSIYFPLLALAAIITGAWVMWVGLAKRQFTKAFQGVLWTVISVVLGVFILSMPQVLAKAPMFINNEITTILFSSFSGGTDSGEDGVSNFCNASAAGGDRLDFASTNMNCQIWKAFVLEPYAQASFGTNLNNLAVGGSTETVADKAIAASGVDPNAFCYNMKTSNSLESQESSTLALSGTDNQLCNLAAAQIITGIDVAEGSKAPPAPGKYDPRWIQLATVVAADEGMWETWTGPNWFNTGAITFFALLAVVLSMLVIIPVSFFALVFYVISIIMMVFAPFFLLIGIIPGRGRKILMSWVQVVIGNIMKYMASAFFLIVTIAIYAGVLSQSTNPFTTFLFVLIFTGALMLYRKEIINLLGKVELGAENITNKAAEKLSSVGNKVGSRTKHAIGATAGGAAGAMLANGAVNPFSVKSIGDSMKATRAGAKEGLTRSLKSQNDFLGNTMRGVELNKNQNLKDIKDTRGALKDKSSEIHEEIKTHESTYNDAINVIATSEAQIGRNNEFIINNSGEVDTIDLVQESVLYDFSENGIQTFSPEFANWQALIDQANNLRIKADVQMKHGDHDAARATQMEINTLDKTAQYIRKTKFDETNEDFEITQQLYRERVEEEYGKITNKKDIKYKDLIDTRKEFYAAAYDTDLLEDDIKSASKVRQTSAEALQVSKDEKAVIDSSIKEYDDLVNDTSKTGLTGRQREREEARIREAGAEQRADKEQNRVKPKFTESSYSANIPSEFAKETLDTYTDDALDIDSDLISEAEAYYAKNKTPKSNNNKPNNTQGSNNKPNNNKPNDKGPNNNPFSRNKR